MVEDAPDDLVHEVFAQQFWSKHPLGRPILGTPETVSSFTSAGLRAYFESTYVAPNLIIAAVQHERRATPAPSAPVQRPAAGWRVGPLALVLAVQSLLAWGAWRVFCG